MSYDQELVFECLRIMRECHQLINRKLIMISSLISNRKIFIDMQMITLLEDFNGSSDDRIRYGNR